ncbi:MAG: hypothetical protein NTV34_16770 [Proteobacteria bacterium]|nr:hypothetical protein [Pseudomonadota bacterium]
MNISNTRSFNVINRPKTKVFSLLMGSLIVCFSANALAQIDREALSIKVRAVPVGTLELFYPERGFTVIQSLLSALCGSAANEYISSLHLKVNGKDPQILTVHVDDNPAEPDHCKLLSPLDLGTGVSANVNGFTTLGRKFNIPITILNSSPYNPDELHLVRERPTYFAATLTLRGDTTVSTASTEAVFCINSRPRIDIQAWLSDGQSTRRLLPPIFRDDGCYTMQDMKFSHAGSWKVMVRDGGMPTHRFELEIADRL